ncbi:hypothetical protein MRX96_021844 [Rhipicephalus microplus]
MTLEKSFFSGSTLDYRAPCTSREGRLCHIFGDLHVWNEFFWRANLELRELSPGELSLVDSYGTRIRYHPGARPLQAHRQAAASLLCHLLTLHHCIVSVNLTNYILETNHEVICDVLYKSTSLKKLKLEPWPFRTSSSRSFTAALPKMNQLQGFDCCDVPLDHATPESLSKFLASTQTLTTLYMSTDPIQDKGRSHHYSGSQAERDTHDTGTHWISNHRYARV